MAKKQEQTPEEKMEKNEKHNDGTVKGLSKTVIGTIGTIVTAGGAAVISLFSGKKEEKTQQSINISVPAQQPVQQPATKTVVIKEKSSDKPAESKPKPKKDEFKDESPKW